MLRCCWYCKSTKSQANHNSLKAMVKHSTVVAGTAKVRNLKQITTEVHRQESTRVLLLVLQKYEISSKSQPQSAAQSAPPCCCWYCKSTKSQANHNLRICFLVMYIVVAGTAKVRNLKQITTVDMLLKKYQLLLLVLQKYEISSKSQQKPIWLYSAPVVAGTAKVRNLKQITTESMPQIDPHKLLLVLQKYEISSKSQPTLLRMSLRRDCCWYCKSTKFQANHNFVAIARYTRCVVAGTAKVRNFKQITTAVPEASRQALSPCA